MRFGIKGVFLNRFKKENYSSLFVCKEYHVYLKGGKIINNQKKAPTGVGAFSEY